MKDPAKQAWEQWVKEHRSDLDTNWIVIVMTAKEAFLAGFRAGAAYWGVACPEIKENP